MQTKNIILASGSPRRQELLRKMGYRFDVVIPDVVEDAVGSVREIVEELSLRKAMAVAGNSIDCIVIASDTLVSLNGIALGKPVDRSHAFSMLQGLSGKTHEVFTGVTVIDTKEHRQKTISVRTGVAFRPLTDEEINAYIDTGESMDKAGAYAIQGGARDFVDRFEGSYENVVGFPVAEIRSLLDEFNVGDPLFAE